MRGTPQASVDVSRVRKSALLRGMRWQKSGHTKRRWKRIGQTNLNNRRRKCHYCHDMTDRFNPQPFLDKYREKS